MSAKTVSIGKIAEALKLSRSQAARRAAELGWAYEAVRAPGAPRLYDISALPREVQDALARRQLEQVQAALREKGILKDEPAAPSPTALVLTPAEKISTGKKAEKRRDARLELYQAYVAFREAAGASDRQALPIFAKHWTLAASAVLAGASLAGLPLPEVISKQPKWVFEAQRSCSPATIKRIAATVKAGALKDLAGRYGGRKDTGVIDRAFDGRAVSTVLALVANNRHLSAAAIRDQVMGNLGRQAVLPDGEIVEWPSIRQFQLWIAKAKTRFADVLTAYSTPDEWRSKYEFAFGEQPVGDAPNDVWQIDASPADALCLDGRWTIYILTDLWSRRIMVLVTKTPRAVAVIALLRRAFLEWGIPRHIKTDNGSDFVATRVKTVINFLKITYEQSAAFSPREKGHVERHVGTVQHGFMPLQPGFIGHSVADAQLIRQRRAFADRLGESDDKAFCVQLTGEQLQARVTEWVEGAYYHKSHGGLDGQSPAERMRSYAGVIRRIEDPRALDMLLMDLPSNGGIRKVTKKGIPVERATFWGPNLTVGEQVRVRLDPTDMGRIYVYTVEADAFICVAENPERVGISRAEVAAKARADQRAETKHHLDQLKSASRRLRPLHEVAMEIARERMAPVVDFPRPVEAYTTPALEAAAEAAGAERPMQVAPAPEGPREPAQIITLGQSPSARDAEAEAKAARVARWKAVDARLKAGEPVSDEDARWHGRYAGHAELITALNMEKWKAAGPVPVNRPA